MTVLGSLAGFVRDLAIGLAALVDDALATFDSDGDDQ